MNQYAISPVPPSNVAASDNAGKNYTLEWEEEFPWDGDYVFNVQVIMKHIYILIMIQLVKNFIRMWWCCRTYIISSSKIKKF